jgi:hypothetical protein
MKAVVYTKPAGCSYALKEGLTSLDAVSIEGSS